jgi:hypothetical protein
MKSSISGSVRRLRQCEEIDGLGAAKTRYSSPIDAALGEHADGFGSG